MAGDVFASRKPALVIAIVGALATAYLIWRFAAPIMDTRPEQDDCSFGPVTNQTYRYLLADAKRRTANQWEPLSGDEAEIGKRLSRRIADLSAELQSMPEQIAAFHAVMRAMGAFVDYPRHPAPLPPSKQYPGASYAMAAAGLGKFDLVDRYAAIMVEYSYDDRVRDTSGPFTARVAFPSFLGRMLRTGVGVADYLPRNAGISCPNVPTAARIEELAARKARE